MEPEQLAQLQDRFEELAACDPKERARRLKELEAAEPELAKALELLLAGDAVTRGLLDTPPEVVPAHPPSDALGVGARIGDYEVVRAIGVGGMGAVYEVRSEAPRRRVALKLLRADLLSERALARFELESETLAKLRHPNIAVVHEVGMHETAGLRLPWFAMELIEEARDLCSHARERALGLHERLRLFLQACDAVAYGHGRGVIHRDLKPANLLVDAGARLRVIDFGIASDETQAGQRTQLTREGELLGTLQYMAPERLRGQAHSDVRGDVYSLGVVLYELLIGQPPWDLRGLSLPQAIRKLDEARELPVAVPPSLPAELGWIVQRSMHPEQDARYPTAEALAADLRRSMRNEPVQAAPPSRLYLARKFVRRNRRLVASLLFAAAMLLVAGVSVTTSLAQVRREQERTLRLADSRDLALLVRRAEALWPVTASMHGELASWLQDAELVRAHRADHEAALELLQRAPRPDSTESWWIESMQELLHEMEAFFGDDGHYTSVQSRLELARSLRADSQDAEAAQRAWQQCIEGVADRERSPAYGGLRIAPQAALVPLGQDRASGLWEFADRRTGAVPRRGRDGQLELSAATAVVFVLLPGGRIHLGAPEAENAAFAAMTGLPGPTGHEQHAVEIEPFFLSKWELTRGQWVRAMGGLPPRDEEALLPATSVSWNACVEALRRFGHALPLDDQWEYAAWGLGADAGPPLAMQAEGVRGFRVTEPRLCVAVSELEPNGLGLVGVLQNVTEWCADVVGPGGECSIRGDYFNALRDNEPMFARPWMTGMRGPTSEHVWLGCRPARPLEP